MSDKIYKKVNESLTFFEKVYNDIESATSKSIYVDLIKLSEEARSIITFDPLICLSEIDTLKKKFPDTHQQYFCSLNSRYQRLSKWIKQYAEYFSQRKHYDKMNNLNLKEKHKIGADLALLKLEECVEIIIKHLQEYSMVEDNNNIETQEVQEQIKKPKGKSTFTREQIGLLFFYLRKKQIIAQPTNGNMAKAIQLLSGHSDKQIQDILKSPETPAYQLGKDNDKVTRNDFRTVISELQTLIDLIQKDFKTYSDNGELK